MCGEGECCGVWKGVIMKVREEEREDGEGHEGRSKEERRRRREEEEMDT